MNTRELTELVEDNISKSDLTDINDVYSVPEEGVMIELNDKGVITDSQYEEIVNNSELMLAVHTMLVEPNTVECELTIIEITDRDGWILDTKAYETNVFDIENPLHIEVNTLIQKALARKFKVRIYQEDK